MYPLWAMITFIHLPVINKIDKCLTPGAQLLCGLWDNSLFFTKVRPSFPESCHLAHLCREWDLCPSQWLYAVYAACFYASDCTVRPKCLARILKYTYYNKIDKTSCTRSFGCLLYWVICILCLIWTNFHYIIVICTPPPTQFLFLKQWKK